MRVPPIRRLGVFGLALTTFIALFAEPASSAGATRGIRSTADRLAPAVFAAGFDARGIVVRREAGLTVERVAVPAAVGAAQPGAPDVVYRVTLAGTYPPRALRYQVLAGGRFVGYGVPTRLVRSLRTVTADPAVLTEVVTARYGDGTAALPPTSLPATREARNADLRHSLATGTGGLDDPAAPGPYAVTRAQYNLGDEVFQPTDLPSKVELKADVHYPTDLSGGPFPLVMFMHGNHYTCYKGDRASYEWPCREGWRALPNFAGYDYIASRLASWGFIVVSVSANGVNVWGNYVEDTGMRQRGEVLEKHIDLWKTWSTTGGDPFGTTFVGTVDLTRIGTMGHSRGGEGVVWNDVVDQERPDPYGIDAVLALAPVDFTRQPINDVPFAVMLPYCDGDVSDLQGVHFFDDSRYIVPGDPTPKDTVTVYGANHNFFNTVWSPSGGYPGSFDDGSWVRCDDRLTAPQERHVGKSYIVGFFRRYLANETALDPMWTGAATPGGIGPATTLVSYLAPDTPTQRMDIDRFVDADALSHDAQGGVVTPEGLDLVSWCADSWQLPCIPGYNSYVDVHLPGLGQGVLGWSDHRSSVRFRLPGGRDVSGFDDFQLRAATNPGYWVNPFGGYQDFAVVLVDGSGARVQVNASDVGNGALAYPLGRRGSGHFILNQVRFPLADFAGVDLTDVRTVVLEFSRSQAGVIDVADVAFSSGAA